MLSHTPKTFNRDCTTVHLHDLNVSQVHYMVLRPECTHRFIVDDCQFEVLSLHRFHLHVTDGFLRINSGPFSAPVPLLPRVMESKQDASGEPFTVTPIITTLELKNLNFGPRSCWVEVGSTLKVQTAMLVSGTYEEPFLFLSIPYWAAVIQNSWAFDDLGTPEALWPWYVQIVLIAVVQLCFPKNHNSDNAGTAVPMYVPMWALLLACVSIDHIVPYIRTSVRIGEFPSDGIWVVLFLLRLCIVSVLFYIVYKYENPNNNGIAFKQLSLFKKVLTVLGWATLWALSIGLNVGGYFLIPYLICRYWQRKRSAHAEQSPEESETNEKQNLLDIAMIDSNGKFTLENVKFTGRLKLV